MKKTVLLMLLFINNFSYSQIINDNFDSETVGTLPTGWVIKYNGTGDANQKVVNTTCVSPDNSFELEGASSWSASLIKELSTVPDKLTYEANVKAEKILSGYTGGFTLYNPDEGSWGTTIGGVLFNDGKIMAYYTGGDKYEIQTYEINRWYHIKIEADLVQKTYQVYIDGNLVSGTYDTITTTSFPMYSSALPTYALLFAGNSGTTKMWFDDVKAYQTNELLAYYPFDGNANDMTENHNDGVVYGATLTTDRLGNPDSAYYFNGTDNYILCNTEVGPFGSDSRTITFWAKTDREPSSSLQNTVLSYGGNVSTGGSRFEIMLNSNCRGIGLDVSVKYLTKEFDNSDNDWHFYAVVLNKDVSTYLTGIRFYADGNLLSNTCTSNGGDIEINTLDEQVLNIGRLFYSGDYRFFKGSLDELKIYNYALTDEEIESIYNGSVQSVAEQNVNDNNVYLWDEQLYLKDAEKKYKNLSIYTITGRQVENIYKPIFPVNVSALPKGIYIIKLIDFDNNIKTRKILQF